MLNFFTLANTQKSYSWKKKERSKTPLPPNFTDQLCWQSVWRLFTGRCDPDPTALARGISWKSQNRCTCSVFFFFFDTIKYSQVSGAPFGSLWGVSDRELNVQWGSCVLSLCNTCWCPPGWAIGSTASCNMYQHEHLPPSVRPVKYADDLTISELLMESQPGLTQKALTLEWGH